MPDLINDEPEEKPEMSSALEESPDTKSTIKPGASDAKSTIKAGKGSASGTPLSASPAALKDAYEAARKSTQGLFTTIALHSDPLTGKVPSVQAVRVQQLQTLLRSYDGAHPSAVLQGFRAMQSKLTAALPNEVDKDEVERRLATLNQSMHKMHMDLLSNVEFNQQAWDKSFQTAQDQVEEILNQAKPSNPANQAAFDKKIKAAKEAFIEDLKKLQTDTAISQLSDMKIKHEEARTTARLNLGRIANNGNQTWERKWDLGDQEEQPDKLEMSSGVPEENGIYRKAGSLIEIHVKDGKAWPNILNLDEQWALQNPKIGSFFKKPSREELSRMAENELMSFTKEKFGHHTITFDEMETHWRLVDLNDLKERMKNAKAQGFKVKLEGNALAAINNASAEKQMEMRALLKEVNDHHHKERKKAEATAAKGIPTEVLDAERKTQVTKNSATHLIEKFKAQQKLDETDNGVLKVKNADGTVRDATPLEAKANIEKELTSIETRYKDLKSGSEFLSEKIKALDALATKDPKMALAQQERLQELRNQMDAEGDDLATRIQTIREVLTADSLVNLGSENLQDASRNEVKENGNVVSMTREINKANELEANIMKLEAPTQQQEADLAAVIKKANDEQAKKENEEKAGNAVGGPGALKPGGN